MKWQSIAADVRLGRDVKIFDFVNLYGCEIGDETRIGTFVEIQRGAKIGRRVKIQSHTFICEGVEIEDGVFVGHNVTFINDKYPRAVTPRANWQGPATGRWWGQSSVKARRSVLGRQFCAVSRLGATRS